MPHPLGNDRQKETSASWYAARTHSGSTTCEPLQLVITSQVNTAVDYHALELQSRPEKNDFDLSTVNVAIGATVDKTTANCYVVKAPYRG